jgi:hypothetical protein
MKSQSLVVVLIAALTIALAATLAEACPTCGKAQPVLPPGSEPVAGGGFNTSIYVLLGTVVAAMGFLVWTFAKTTRGTVSPGETATRD